MDAWNMRREPGVFLSHGVRLRVRVMVRVDHCRALVVVVVGCLLWCGDVDDSGVVFLWRIARVRTEISPHAQTCSEQDVRLHMHLNTYSNETVLGIYLVTPW